MMPRDGLITSDNVPTIKHKIWAVFLGKTINGRRGSTALPGEESYSHYSHGPSMSNPPAYRWIV
jgi:hypothetical protein